MGSVKDLIVIEPAYENRPGLGNFLFSDRYSVFDWGEMPDHLPGKGRSLALMAAFNFELLESRGIRTHYQGLVGRDGRLFRFSDLKEGEPGSQTMQVSLARVYRPLAREFLAPDGRPEVRYDYSFFNANRGRINNYLIGLEIIFRNGLPQGSSVFAKIEEAKRRDDPRESRRALGAILKGLGLKEEPLAGRMLPRPVMSYTTKLEVGDRSLGREEARRLSGLSGREFKKLEALALRVDELVSEQAGKAGLAHYDGKIEMLYDRGLAVCDVTGTFDENRFSCGGAQIGKEVLRQWYKKTQPGWVAACEEWKSTGAGWQQRCQEKPKKLPPELAALATQLYTSGCNRYTGKRVFDAPELEAVLERLQAFRG